MIEINKLNVPAKPRSKYKNNYSSGSFSYAGSSGSNTIIEKCDLLTTTDEDEATDEVAFSSLRTEQDLLKKIDAEDKYLSKDKDDTANGVITFESGIIVKSKDNTRKVSKAISEAGVMAFGFNTDIIEEGDESDSLNSNIEEISFYSGSGATTIGELSNVDELADNITEEDVVLVKWKGTDVYVPIEAEGFSFTGIKYDLQLQINLYTSQFATQIGETSMFSFTFIHK